jgi:MoaA/NifB/PqqE/SkfB family radical SAM enzyme
MKLNFLMRHRFNRLTVMLTETCNLDCWMCDFRVSMKTKKRLAYSPTQLVDLLDHRAFSGHLDFIVFTGGEPFANPQVTEYVTELQNRHPRVVQYFSSNCTLVDRMIRTYELLEKNGRAGLLVSLDGIEMHDRQRGKEGSFAKTTTNLLAIRGRFPKLPITLKYTITPVNYHEIAATFREARCLGFPLTFKMLEFNPFYTNKKSDDASAFAFTPEQVDVIRAQLREVLSNMDAAMPRARRKEIEEILVSLEPGWTRGGNCAIPFSDGFLDCDLNLFTCKEYAPVVNLAHESLDDYFNRPEFTAIVEHEAENSGKCTRCTSQMKRKFSPATSLRRIMA